MLANPVRPAPARRRHGLRCPRTPRWRRAEPCNRTSDTTRNSSSGRRWRAQERFMNNISAKDAKDMIDLALLAVDHDGGKLVEICMTVPRGLTIALLLTALGM